VQFSAFIEHQNCKSSELRGILYPRIQYAQFYHLQCDECTRCNYSCDFWHTEWRGNVYCI